MNGKNSAGSQQFLRKDCRKSVVMYSQNQRSQEEKDQILSACHERQQCRAWHTFSDFWDACEKVFPKETHRSVGKETGETCHMERGTVRFAKS